MWNKREWLTGVRVGDGTRLWKLRRHALVVMTGPLHHSMGIENWNVSGFDEDGVREFIGELQMRCLKADIPCLQEISSSRQLTDAELNGTFSNYYGKRSGKRERQAIVVNRSVGVEGVFR